MIFGRNTRIYIIGLVVLIIVPSIALADITPTAVPFFAYVNSAPANGMGGCAVNLVDEHSALYNPGASGLFFMNKYFRATVPFSTNWVPQLTDDVRFKTWSVGAGLSDDVVDLGFDDKLHYSVSISYSRLRTEYGTFTVTDEFGTVLGTFDSYDRATYYTVAAGFQYYVRVGLGFTHKTIESNLMDLFGGEEMGEVTSEGSAHDYGVLVELPIHDMIDLSGSAGGNLAFNVTPSVAYVKANIGDPMPYYTPAEALPLPKISKLGLSLYLGAAVNKLRVGSLRLSYEKVHDLVSEAYEAKQYGVEFNLLGFVNVRAGKYDYHDSELEYNTSGVGLQLSAFTQWLASRGTLGDKNTLLYRLANRLDINWDYATYSHTESPLAATNFLGISFSI